VDRHLDPVARLFAQRRRHRLRQVAEDLDPERAVERLFLGPPRVIGDHAEVEFK
jgi:hypothetical protein